MNRKLLRSCASLWILGMVGMWVARALFEVEPGALSFQLAARFFFVGGLGYTGIGLLDVVSRRAPNLSAREASPDLSALIRRR